MGERSGVTPEPKLLVVDHAARYQLLDHATNQAALWDARRRITTYALDGVIHLRHRDRTPEELRPELEALLRERHVELFEADGHHALPLEVAISVIVDDANWYVPASLGGDASGRPTIHELVLTASGEEEFTREYQRANSS